MDNPFVIIILLFFGFFVLPFLCWYLFAPDVTYISLVASKWTCVRSETHMLPQFVHTGKVMVPHYIPVSECVEYRRK